jgi:hypothetical protein
MLVVVKLLVDVWIEWRVTLGVEREESSKKSRRKELVLSLLLSSPHPFVFFPHVQPAKSDRVPTQPNGPSTGQYPVPVTPFFLLTANKHFLNTTWAHQSPWSRESKEEAKRRIDRSIDAGDQGVMVARRHA